MKAVDVAPFVAGQLLGLLVNLLLINLWEEAAWSGIVQTRLERRHGPVRAALLTAVPFALAHLPLHFIGDFTVGSLLTALVTLMIVCSLVRLMIGMVLRRTRYSILVVALLHTMFNRSNNDDGLVAGVLAGDGRKLARTARRTQPDRSHRLRHPTPEQERTLTRTGTVPHHIHRLLRAWA